MAASSVVAQPKSSTEASMCVRMPDEGPGGLQRPRKSGVVRCASASHRTIVFFRPATALNPTYARRGSLADRCGCTALGTWPRRRKRVKLTRHRPAPPALDTLTDNSRAAKRGFVAAPCPSAPDAIARAYGLKRTGTAMIAASRTTRPCDTSRRRRDERRQGRQGRQRFIADLRTPASSGLAPPHPRRRK